MTNDMPGEDYRGQLAPKPGNLSHWDEENLWALEERFWTGGAHSARRMTSRGAVFVFPYPAGIL